jgi:hypothetical protein
MNANESPDTPLSSLLRSRPRAFRRTFIHDVLFWIFLFTGIAFVINTIYLVTQGFVMYAMIGVTSSQIAYNYQVSEAEVRHLLVSSVRPFAYKMIAYSASLAFTCFFSAAFCRKLIKRARYIVALERAATEAAAPAPPSGSLS